MCQTTGYRSVFCPYQSLCIIKLPLYLRSAYSLTNKVIHRVGVEKGFYKHVLTSSLMRAVLYYWLNGFGRRASFFNTCSSNLKFLGFIDECRRNWPPQDQWYQIIIIFFPVAIKKSSLWFCYSKCILNDQLYIVLTNHYHSIYHILQNVCFDKLFLDEKMKGL